VLLPYVPSTVVLVLVYFTIILKDWLLQSSMSKGVGRAPLKPLPPLPHPGDTGGLGSDLAAAGKMDTSLHLHRPSTLDDRTRHDTDAKGLKVSANFGAPALAQMAAPTPAHHSAKQDGQSPVGAVQKSLGQENTSVPASAPEVPVEQEPPLVDDQEATEARLPSPPQPAAAATVVKDDAETQATSNGLAHLPGPEPSATHSTVDALAVKDAWLPKDVPSGQTFLGEDRTTAEDQEGAPSPGSHEAGFLSQCPWCCTLYMHDNFYYLNLLAIWVCVSGLDCVRRKCAGLSRVESEPKSTGEFVVSCGGIRKQKFRYWAPFG
jgi:hypothetical protein